MEPIIKVDNVSMCFNLSKEKHESLKEYFLAMVQGRLQYDEFYALKDVSLDIMPGDFYGLVGLNGSGKSTLLKTIAGVYKPSKGKVTVNGTIAPLIELGAGFDMDLTARENIYLNGTVLGFSPKYLDEKFDEIVEFSELENFLDVPLKNYSSGMVARIGFAIATITKPDILIADEVLSVGDVLLVQGNWSDIARLEREEDDWVVLGQPLAEAAQVTLTYRAPLAGAILLLMVAMMVFDFIPVAPVTAVLLAAVLMVLCGCFRNVEAAYKTINWESLVLIAAMMPMSVALEKTGASALLSHTLVDGLGVVGPVALLAGIYFTTSLLTLFISNTATDVLMAPIALSSAAEMGISPYAFLFAVTLGASMCFASPFSTPPNALVMQAGRYSFMDYIKVGIPLQVIMGLVMLIVLPLLFPF